LKTPIFILLAFFLCDTTFSQEAKKIESLDSFFAGIPLQKKYEQWVAHINSHPYLGIDSTNKKNIYSSFKPGVKSHFPFPDSIKVKLLLYSAINIDSLGKFPNDTIKTVSIEGIFGNNKKSRKEAYTCFNDLKLLLKNYHGIKNDGPPFDDAAGFIKGINENFPDVMLFRGYNEEQHFYYVLLLCEFRQRISFKMPKLLPAN
jgi:hypothetical protein